MKRLVSRICDLWAAYRLLRIVAYVVGSLTGLSLVGLAGYWLNLLDTRLEALRDGPEYAADITARMTPLPHLGSPALPRLPHVDASGVPIMLIVVMLTLLLALKLLTSLRLADPRNGPEGWRDQPRTFPDRDREWINRCAGGRCEHRTLGVFRCRAEITDLDHHYPWSKGGATVRGNLVGLCKKHNLRKTNHIPTRLDTWWLKRARRRYFPADDLEVGLRLDGRKDEGERP